MKINRFNENISNLSKVRKWKTYLDSGIKNNDNTDFYFTYNLKNSELGDYLNTWFTGKSVTSKNEDILRDEMITLKKVDKESAAHLYGKKYNPISIIIMCPTGAKWKQAINGDYLYEMKAQIHSIDDSSYGIWWTYQDGSALPLNELIEIRKKLMTWINSKIEINGEEFLDYCVTLGASEEQKDYN